MLGCSGTVIGTLSLCVYQLEVTIYIYIYVFAHIHVYYVCVYIYVCRIYTYIYIYIYICLYIQHWKLRTGNNIRASISTLERCCSNTMKMWFTMSNLQTKCCLKLHIQNSTNMPAESTNQQSILRWDWQSKNPYLAQINQTHRTATNTSIKSLSPTTTCIVQSILSGMKIFCGIRSRTNLLLNAPPWIQL